MRTVILYAPLLVLCCVARAAAEEAPAQDPNDAVFTATQIVIVSPGKPPAFKVERSYRGKLAVGSKIDLPKFKLETWEGSDEPRPVEMTKDTRILLFLCPQEENPAALGIVDDWAYFFRGVEQINELDTMAKDAIAIHKKWTAARDERDPRDRIVALYPYLLHWESDDPPYTWPSGTCRELTVKELAKLTPASGDYLASKLPTASPTDRQQFLLDICELQSPAAHDAAMVCVDQAVARLKAYLADHHLEKLDIREHLHGLPLEIHDDYTTIHWGLFAVESFKDPKDLPYFRRLVPLLVASNYEMSVGACLAAMYENPVPENVPVLISIWEGYRPIWADLKARDEWLKNAPPGAAVPARNVWLTNAAPVGGPLAGCIGAHKDPALIPVLLDLLDLPLVDSSAMPSLRKLTGEDFRTPAEWKAWYAAQPQPAAKTEKAAP